MHVAVEEPFKIFLDAATLQDVVRQLRRESRRMLLHVLERVLGEVERRLLATPIRCPTCARPMRNRGRSARRIVTSFGTVAFGRVRFQCAPCGTLRRPLDEWLGIVDGTEYTMAVREQALYLAAELPYERAADVLRHVGGIGISGRQIQRLLLAESERIAHALGTPVPETGPNRTSRFRRAGKRPDTRGAQSILQLRRLKSSGRWDDYWSARFRSAARGVGQAARRSPG